jgi:hypothetical protein
VGRSRKSGWAALLVLATVGLLIGIVRWSGQPRPPAGHTVYATAEACLAGYRAAIQDGEAGGYLRCLGEPLRSEARRQHPNDRDLREALRREWQDVKGWALYDRPEELGDQAFATVEEVRASCVRELRFHLQRSGGVWLIVAIDKVRERSPSIPYGTRTGNEPESKR